MADGSEPSGSSAARRVVKQGYSLEEKIWICDQSRVHKRSYTLIEQGFPAAFGRSGPKQGTISGILKNEAKWRKVMSEGNVDKIKGLCRVVEGKQKHIEEAVVIFIDDTISRNGRLTDEGIREFAAEVAQEAGITNFKFSAKWFRRVKRDHAISTGAAHGESGSADMEAAALAQKWLPAFYKEVGASIDDVFNNDETGLFFRQLPKRTIRKGRVRGLKLAKDRITVLACCNLTGVCALNAYIELFYQ
jgi:hypothetical protein